MHFRPVLASQRSARGGIAIVARARATVALLVLCSGGARVMGGAACAFRNPHNLPVKSCVVYGLPFTWRKKWERD